MTAEGNKKMKYHKKKQKLFKKIMNENRFLNDGAANFVTFSSVKWLSATGKSDRLLREQDASQSLIQVCELHCICLSWDEALVEHMLRRYSETANTKNDSCS